MSFYTFGIKSMAYRDSLIPISDDDPIVQMFEFFNGKNNKFNKAVMDGIKKYEKEARSNLSMYPEWADIASHLTVELSTDGQSLSYSVQGGSDIEQKYMELEYGGPNNGAGGRVRSMANSGDILAKILDNALEEVM
jgi:hypothetical protein